MSHQGSLLKQSSHSIELAGDPSVSGVGLLDQEAARRCLKDYGQIGSLVC